MKRLLTGILLLLFASSAFGQTSWFTGSLEEAKDAARNEKKHILLNLTSTSS